MFSNDHRIPSARVAGVAAQLAGTGAGAGGTGARVSCPTARVAGALAGAAVAGYLLPGLAGAWPPLRRPLGIEDRTADGGGFALTFDDGPHPHGTPAVLEQLAREGVRATFFLVGERVERAPELVREIVLAGHEIGLHCHRHRNLLRLAPWQVREDIARARAIIEEASGRRVRLYRPPYGVLNSSALLLARRHRWRTLLWSHWGRDWEARATPQSIATRATDGAGAGSVLLLHDGDDYGAAGSWRRTAAAVPQICRTLAERGLQAQPA
jgi:peptidoglycan-N-acetylglucosamine deacetylase